MAAGDATVTGDDPAVGEGDALAAGLPASGGSALSVRRPCSAIWLTSLFGDEAITSS